jgi:DNA-binding transcriptional LysR family regulator
MNSAGHENRPDVAAGITVESSVVPSLDDFHARYPEIDLMLGVSVVARHEELRAA